MSAGRLVRGGSPAATALCATLSTAAASSRADSALNVTPDDTNDLRNSTGSYVIFPREPREDESLILRPRDEGSEAEFRLTGVQRARNAASFSDCVSVSSNMIRDCMVNGGVREDRMANLMVDAGSYLANNPRVQNMLDSFATQRSLLGAHDEQSDLESQPPREVGEESDLGSSYADSGSNSVHMPYMNEEFQAEDEEMRNLFSLFLDAQGEKVSEELFESRIRDFVQRQTEALKDVQQKLAEKDAENLKLRADLEDIKTRLSSIENGSRATAVRAEPIKFDNEPLHVHDNSKSETPKKPSKKWFPPKNWKEGACMAAVGISVVAIGLYMAFNPLVLSRVASMLAGPLLKFLKRSIPRASF